MFQDVEGNVFVINGKVQYSRVVLVAPGDDVLTLVDADGVFCKPDYNILVTVNLRVLLTSPSRSRADRKWLKQFIDSNASYVMEPWCRL